jgi:hypothetical protein
MIAIPPHTPLKSAEKAIALDPNLAAGYLRFMRLAVAQSQTTR